jgi:hypothetical protein
MLTTNVLVFVSLLQYIVLKTDNKIIGGYAAGSSSSYNDTFGIYIKKNNMHDQNIYVNKLLKWQHSSRLVQIKIIKKRSKV